MYAGAGVQTPPSPPQKMDEVIKYLRDNGVEHTLHTHPAVFTCEDSDIHCKHIPGVPSKNLFIRDKKGENYYLVILPATKRADLKQLAGTLSTQKISFASPERLMEKLNLKPGSVSPFGLINNEEGTIKVLIDREIFDAAIVSFHPNDNTATIELTKEMFQKYLGTLDHEIEVTLL